MRFNEKIKVLTESFTIKEELDSGNLRVKSVKLRGKAITPDKPTRNNVSYTRASIEATMKSLIGKPFLDSHNDSSVRSSAPFGHVTNAWMEADGLYYEVDLDPNEKVFIQKAKRGDIPGVSIQVLVENVDQKNGFVEATVSEFLELSAVLIPGDGDSSVRLAEALKSKGANICTNCKGSRANNTSKECSCGKGGDKMIEGFMARCPQCGKSDMVKKFSDDVTGMRKYKCLRCGVEFGTKREEDVKKKIRMIGEVEKDHPADKFLKGGKTEDLNNEEEDNMGMKEEADYNTPQPLDKERSDQQGDDVSIEPFHADLEKGVKDKNADESDMQLKLAKKKMDMLPEGESPDVRKSGDRHIKTEQGDAGPGAGLDIDFNPEDLKADGKGVSENSRRLTFKCETCGRMYKRRLRREHRCGLKEISCPSCGSTKREFIKRRIRNNFRKRLLREECGLKKREDITTGNAGGALTAVVPAKKKKVENFSTKMFREEMTIGDVMKKEKGLNKFIKSKSKK